MVLYVNISKQLFWW